MLKETNQTIFGTTIINYILLYNYRRNVTLLFFRDGKTGAK